MRAVFQARIAILFGAGLLLIGFLKTAVGSGQGAAPFLGMGIAVLGLGGFFRLWTRRQWLRGTRSRQPEIADARWRLLSGPFGGFWVVLLGVTLEGTVCERN